MAWTDGNNYYPAQTWNQDSERMQIIQQPIPQQPTMIIQQLPSAMPPAALPFRPGHIKEDLVELMMIQNAQMHQVIMNNMTMSAMSAFGYSHPTPQPSVEPPRVPIIVEEEEPESVYHHHYEPLPFPTYPAWLQQPQMPVRQNQDPVVRHVNHDRPASVHKDMRAVPPPPPPSATRTVGADIPPAAEYYDATEGRL